MALGEIKALLFSDGIAVTAATTAPIGQTYFKTDASNWNGSATTVTYTVSAADDNGNVITDARPLTWMLKDVASNNYAAMTGCVIDHYPTVDKVRVTFGADFPPPAGTYYLVGR